jgi:hypothetical protein
LTRNDRANSRGGALVPVLRHRGRRYLVGAQAVVLYGVPRLGADVDVTVALTPDTPERFAEDMRVAGFALRVSGPDFVRPDGRKTSKVRQASGGCTAPPPMWAASAGRFGYWKKPCPRVTSWPPSTAS